ncbi:MAG: acetyl-CoA acetyltransferase [SAR202 cluster bacterium]|nr:acetyl-CoA acetyltransferase [SAR202 cluster bacterium]
MGSIRDRVAVVGMGATKTGELWTKGFDDLILEAATEAMADAGVETKDLQAGFMGIQYVITAQGNLTRALKTGDMPATQVLNGCATGGDVFRMASMAVASGLYDIVIACGAEKLKDEGGTGIPGSTLLRGTGAGGGGGTASGAAPYAVRYAHKYGYSMDEMKRSLGHIAIKNHHNGTRNPKAAFQKAITWEQYINAPWISWPLGLYDCCANVDGAAAAILTTPEIARKLKDSYVLVRGIGCTTSDGWMGLSTQFDHASLPGNRGAAQIAYQMAGIKDPVKELSEVQIHDAFSIVELLCYEALGLCPPGQAPKYIEAGFFDAEGEMPVNTDGGLKCFGHPIGATGLKELYEPYLQLQGRAGPRQVKNPRLALSQNQSGANASSSVVTVLAARD